MTSVLLAEDDPAISEPLARALRREGYEVGVAADGPGTLEAARAGGIDLIVLDIGLPKLDGLEVCRRIRSAGQSIPVLILTARADEVDTVIGLDAGADDYVTKPFRLAELLARVRALLRRGASESRTVQGVRVDSDARRAWLGDTEIELTSKEFDLLALMVAEAARWSRASRLCARSGTPSGGARPRPSTCTYRGCAANLATTRTTRSSSPRSGAWASDLSAAINLPAGVSWWRVLTAGG